MLFQEGKGGGDNDEVEPGKKRVGMREGVLIFVLVSHHPTLFSLEINYINFLQVESVLPVTVVSDVPIFILTQVVFFILFSLAVM